VLVARGGAREYAKAQLFSGKAAEAEPDPEPTSDGPPVKVVPIRDGVRDNDPGAPKAR
jgi:hypothetical protein